MASTSLERRRAAVRCAAFSSSNSLTDDVTVVGWDTVTFWRQCGHDESWSSHLEMHASWKTWAHGTPNIAQPLRPHPVPAGTSSRQPRTPHLKVPPAEHQPRRLAGIDRQSSELSRSYIVQWKQVQCLPRAPCPAASTCFAAGSLSPWSICPAIPYCLQLGPFAPRQLVNSGLRDATHLLPLIADSGSRMLLAPDARRLEVAAGTHQFPHEDTDDDACVEDEADGAKQ
eukprot:scaffold279045_cov36-Tisochrysis_lutea.AAC.2